MSDIINSDTIFAQATPPGRSAIAVIRISGPDSWNILDKLASKKLEYPVNTLKLAVLPGLDQVMSVRFKAPNSFTGEDSVEIFTHGSQLIIEKISEKISEYGGRYAEPGEFTFRAVLNGKMTVSEAEILNARIHAHSDLQLSLLDIAPQTSDLFKDLLESAYDAVAELESDIEFQEGEGLSSLQKLEDKMLRLTTQATLNKKYSALPSVLLHGRANCGKSTLFNAILGYERSIVSAVPGTTRDYIETEFTLGGTSFRLIDSAGIRNQSDDHIEREGMAITDRLYKEADIIIEFDENFDKNDDRVIFIRGKSDLLKDKNLNELYVSGKTGEGIPELLNIIAEKLRTAVENQNWNMWISDFAAGVLENLNSELNKAKKSSLPEIQSLHLNKFCDILRSRLDMEPDDLYDRIFSRFCIGK